MSQYDPVIDELSRVNPVSPDHGADGGPISSTDDAILERILRDPGPPARSRRRVAGVVGPVLGLLVTAAVIFAASRIGTERQSTRSASAPAGALVVRVLPSAPGRFVSSTDAARDATVLRARLRAAGIVATVTRSSAPELIIAPADAAARRAAIALIVSAAAPTRVLDWEASVIAPDGQTAAVDETRGDAAGFALSQGAGSPTANPPAAGGQSLYDAVSFAAHRRPLAQSTGLTRIGSVLYRFADPRTRRCPGSTPCYLAGPASTRTGLDAQMPPSSSAARTRTLVVPQGISVLQATGENSAIGAAASRFFVVRDEAALTLADVTQVRAATVNGLPAVVLSLDARGRRRLHALTRTLAQRGANVSLGANTYEQHFALVTGERLIAVPYINFHTNPFGLVGSSGSSVEVLGGLTPAAARQLAARLEAPALPFPLQLIAS